MSDTWGSIQAHKKQLDSLRERLQRRRKQEPLDLRNPDLVLSPPLRSDSPVPSSVTPGTATEPGDLVTDPELEKKILHHLSDLGLALPTDALTICQAIFTVSQEILELLNTTTAKEQSIVEKFRSRGRAQVQEFCDYGTKEECMKASDAERPCRKLHFRRIINKHTDESLGDCSFLNTCFHMDTCKYVHYEIDACTDLDAPCGRELLLGQELALPQAVGRDSSVDRLFPPQALFRVFPLRYERVDEIIWVKTNQLQRIIRTGRTGHWLNHGKEHCLVGVKGNPQGFNRGLDCDVIVAEVRSTSHKPDEIYGMIERLSPGTRKIELFGRPHNVQPN
ncbi:N6-adenosine-methyltransferase subunit METTL3-like, partial [Protobothrops mucrosquamatus]|uniref:N6-adenosine-methyltransferase subunit METTL3-like n=1 Tax=Protobothrops mucrosquamatus TaxID=103944 RepID=UPI000775FD55